MKQLADLQQIKLAGTYLPIFANLAEEIVEEVITSKVAGELSIDCNPFRLRCKEFGGNCAVPPTEPESGPEPVSKCNAVTHR